MRSRPLTRTLPGSLRCENAISRLGLVPDLSSGSHRDLQRHDRAGFRPRSHPGVADGSRCTPSVLERIPKLNVASTHDGGHEIIRKVAPALGAKTFVRSAISSRTGDVGSTTSYAQALNRADIEARRRLDRLVAGSGSAERLRASFSRESRSVSWMHRYRRMAAEIPQRSICSKLRIRGTTEPHPIHYAKSGAPHLAQSGAPWEEIHAGSKMDH